jgi:hypothetical protein
MRQRLKNVNHRIINGEGYYRRNRSGSL